MQIAGAAALNGPQDFVKGIVDRLSERRDFAWKRLNEIEGISTTKPEGAFYIFPKIHDVGTTMENDMEFVVELLKETGVLIVNGSGSTQSTVKVMQEQFSCRHAKNSKKPSTA